MKDDKADDINKKVLRITKKERRKQKKKQKKERKKKERRKEERRKGGQRGLARGNQAENITREALGSMKKDGEIAGFIENGKNDRLDSEGIDFLAFFNNGLSLTIQIKTLSHKKKSHTKRQGSEKPSKKIFEKIFFKEKKKSFSKRPSVEKILFNESATDRYKRLCLKEHRRKHPLVMLLVFVDIRLYKSQPDVVIESIKKEVRVFLKKIK
jgi:hypothetical protein